MISSEKDRNIKDEIVPLNDMAPDHDDLIKQSHEKETARGQFANKMDYLLSLIGYSVGLANIWRFPYLCYQNGGGAFLFPYMICLIFCGVPLFFMEVSIGQFTSRSSATMWSICPLFKGVGWASVVVSLLCSWYFNVLLSYAIFFIYQSLTFDYLPWHWCGREWNSAQCLDYNNDTIARQYSQYLDWKRNGSDENFWQEWFSQYANVSWKSPSEEYFNGAVLQLSKGLEEPGGIVWGLVPCLLIGWLLTFLCLIKGVESSGKAVYFTATFPYILLTVLLIKGLTLEGAMDGIMFYIKPNFTTLLNPKPWSDAAFQVFFSLGPGWGGLVTMGSYNRFHNNVYRDSMYLPLLMELTSVYAGFVVFSVLGFMAHKMGRPVVEVVTEGPSLFFITYPEIVTKLPLSQVWSALFFFMVVIVGLDTEFVMIETAITAIYDEMPDRFKVKVKRIWILTGTCTVLFLLGLVFVLRSGAYLLHLVDVYSSFYALMVVCIIELISVGWLYGAEKFLSDIQFMIGYRPTSVWSFSWRFITLAIVATIFVMALGQFSSTLRYGSYHYPQWASSGLALFIVLLSISMIPAYMLWYFTQLEIATSEQSIWTCRSASDFKSYLINRWTILKQKLRVGTRPTPAWGPVNPTIRAEWTSLQKCASYNPGFFGQFSKKQSDMQRKF